MALSRQGLALARARFLVAQEAEDQQLARERADLRMYADDQWPDDVRAARMGQDAQTGMPPIPARPCLTINKLREPVRQVLNQEREADIGVEIVPADDFGELGVELDDTEIQLREGLVRRIQRESDAADARSWAFERATIAGRGYELVMTRYVGHLSIQGRPGPGAFDQEIYVHRIYDQSAVRLDPAHELPDGSDAAWGFVGTFLSWEDYQAQFPRAARRLTRGGGDGAFAELVAQYPAWFRADGEVRQCMVVDYYYTDLQSRVLALLEDGTCVWDDERPEDTAAVTTRRVIEPTVKFAKIDGANDEPLEETDWPGRYIPIVKFLGEELQPYDDERRSQGMVRPGRDAQQGFNAMASKGVETVGYAPIPPWMVAEGQIAGYELAWNVSNTRALPYLTYKTRDLEQNVVGAPQRTPTEVDLTGIFTCLQMFDEAVKSTTGVPAVALGEQTDSALKSGKAIKALQSQAAAGTSNYMDNYQRSVRHEGAVINDLLYPIYGKRPGRLARIVNGEGEAETLTLGQPKDGKTYALTPDAKVNTVIKVTKNYDTRREQESTLVGDLIASAPMLMTWFGDLFFKNQDGPGHEQMAERAKVMLDPKIQQMLAEKAKSQPMSPDVQAQLAQLQGQLQQAQQQLQQAGQTIQTKQVESQSDLQQEQMKQQGETERARLDAELKIHLAQIDNAARIEVARIGAAKQMASIQAEAQEERLSTGLQLDAQAQQASVGAQQASAEAEVARQHEATMGAQQQASAAAQADAQRAHEAAMTPPAPTA